MVNVFVAVFWAILGACLFLLEREGRPLIRTSIPYLLPTVALFLVLYNVLRLLAARYGGGPPRGASRSDWHRPPLRRPGDDVITPDPNFNFSDQPPAPKASEGPPVNGSRDAEKQ